RETWRVPPLRHSGWTPSGRRCGGSLSAAAPQRQWARRMLRRQERKETCGGSFDHLVGAAEDRRRDRKAERPGGLEVDRQLEPGRLLHRRFARSRSLQHLVDEIG